MAMELGRGATLIAYFRLSFRNTQPWSIYFLGPQHPVGDAEHARESRFPGLVRLGQVLARIGLDRGDGWHARLQIGRLDQRGAGADHVAATEEYLLLSRNRRDQDHVGESLRGLHGGSPPAQPAREKQGV